MNYSDTDFDQIQRYLLGEMTTDEQAAMELHIQSDQAWAEQVQKERAVIFVVRHNRQLELKRMLQAVDLDEQNENEEINSTPPKKTGKLRKPRWRMPLLWLPMAAAVALLLVLFWPKKMYTAKESFDKYGVPFEFSDKTRGSSQPFDSLATLAIEKYSVPDYDGALLLLPSNATNPVHAFLRGNCFWSKQQYDSAKVAFEAVVDADSLFTEEAAWYLAILPLKDGDAQSARPKISAIANSKGTYRARAKALLSTLKDEP